MFSLRSLARRFRPKLMRNHVAFRAHLSDCTRRTALVDPPWNLSKAGPPTTWDLRRANYGLVGPTRLPCQSSTHSGQATSDVAMIWLTPRRVWPESGPIRSKSRNTGRDSVQLWPSSGRTRSKARNYAQIRATFGPNQAGDVRNRNGRDNMAELGPTSSPDSTEVSQIWPNPD